MGEVLAWMAEGVTNGDIKRTIDTLEDAIRELDDAREAEGEERGESLAEAYRLIGSVVGDGEEDE